MFYGVSEDLAKSKLELSNVEDTSNPKPKMNVFKFKCHTCNRFLLSSYILARGLCSIVTVDG